MRRVRFWRLGVFGFFAGLEGLAVLHLICARKGGGCRSGPRRPLIVNFSPFGVGLTA